MRAINESIEDCVERHDQKDKIEMEYRAAKKAYADSLLDDNIDVHEYNRLNEDYLQKMRLYHHSLGYISL